MEVAVRGASLASKSSELDMVEAFDAFAAAGENVQGPLSSPIPGM